MKEIFDWKIIYEALSGIPLQFGVEVTNSVVVCSLEISGTSALLGGTVRIDAEVMQEPDVVIDILSGHRQYGYNGALIAVVNPALGLRVDDFFDHVYKNWPLAYHAGNVVQVGQTIAAGCGCGQNKQFGDSLELLATTTSMQYDGRFVLPTERDYRARRTPGGGFSRKIAELIAMAPTPPDTVRATAHVVREMKTRGSITLQDRADILCALEVMSFRDGLISWATSKEPPPRDFTTVRLHDSAPNNERAGAVIGLLLGICRWLPEGDAAAPIASAAYLAWYSGNGLQARVLVEQALEENEEYSLARLVSNALVSMIPPAWVTTSRERLVS